VAEFLINKISREDNWVAKLTVDYFPVAPMMMYCAVVERPGVIQITTAFDNDGKAEVHEITNYKSKWSVGS
jgi:hypothetical protein